MKLSEILLFITLLFTGWFGLEKQKQCDKKDKALIGLKARVEFYEMIVFNTEDSLETFYVETSQRFMNDPRNEVYNKPKKAR